ncbi:unnamed protein product [Choristocarpus tenellus]
MKVSNEPCGVCSNVAAKYRCPGCSIPYCSLGCFKAHKTGLEGRPACSGKRERPKDGSREEVPKLNGGSKSVVIDDLLENDGKRPKYNDPPPTVACEEVKDGNDCGEGVGMGTSAQQPPREDEEAGVEPLKGLKDEGGGEGVGMSTNAQQPTREDEEDGQELLKGLKDEEEEWQLTAEQKSRLASSNAVRAALRDPKLQSLLIYGN